MRLIYINQMGPTHKGQYVYEFIFSEEEDLKEVEGIDWDSLPALGMPGTPSDEFVNKVSILKTEKNFILVKNSEIFSMYDAVDGVIALAWEDITEFSVYPDKRLFFTYGEDYTEVYDKLYKQDMFLEDEE